jgi:hypothetical protein
MSRLRVLFLATLCLTLVACSLFESGVTVTPHTPQLEPSPTPSPTRGLLPAADEQSATPPSVQGEVEIRIPYWVGTGDAPPADVPECVTAIPFELTADGPRTMIEGEDSIQCEFENPTEGGPITIYVVLEFDGILSGELLPPTPDQPSGWLDAYLLLDGTIVQFYTGYPPEAINPCPESSPCRTPTSDVIPLPFAYEEGSTVTTAWTFILHLR